MKKILTLFLSLALVITNLTACAAEIDNSEDISIILQIGSSVMTVNGEEKPIDAEGTAPVIVNDRTLLPVRAVVEEMGGTVAWNGDTQTVTLNYGADEIRLVIDNTAAYLNDTAQTLDVAPTIINDRTMLPIRFIAESFKFAVSWDETTKTVTIEKNISANENIIKLSWDNKEILVKLNDSNASKDLISRLPLTMEFEDYNNTEKVSYLDEKLDDSGSDDSYNPNIGDLTSYIPWGTLSLYDYARMCKKTSNCDDCPLGRNENGENLDCEDFVVEEVDKANEIILKWCEEHPIKTRQDRFLNMFLNAKVTSDCLDICPREIDKTYTCKFNPDTCDKCKRKYWLAEVKE